MGDFTDQKGSPLRGGKSNFFDFFNIRASATTTIFRYGLPLVFFSKGDNTKRIGLKQLVGAESGSGSILNLMPDPDQTVVVQE